MNGVGGARNLRGATNDAKNIKEALTKHFKVQSDEIKILVDTEASRDAILTNFRDWLIKDTEKGDRVVFYFAGHGAQVEDKNGDEGDDKFDEVLVPSDTKGELEGADAGLSGFITDDEIGELLADLPGREVMMIVNSCHSGTITRGALEIRQSGASGDPSGQGVDADGTYSGVRTLTPNGPIGVIDLDDLATREAHRTGTRMIEVVGTAPPAPETPAASPTPATSSASDTESVQLAVWTAAASAQLAVEDKDLGGSQGLFTNRFVKGSPRAPPTSTRTATSPPPSCSPSSGPSRTAIAKIPVRRGRAQSNTRGRSGYDDHPVGDTTTQPRPRRNPQDTARHRLDRRVAGVRLPDRRRECFAHGGDHLRYGDPLRIKVESEYAGDLIVLDIRDDGTTVQLFRTARRSKSARRQR